MATRCCCPPESWPGRRALQPVEAHEPQCAPYPFAPALRVDATHLQGEREVLAHRHVRKQRVVLEHHADAALPGRNLLHGAPTDADGARRRRLEAGEHHQARGLAGSGRPQEGQELAPADPQIEVAHHPRPAVEALADSFELYVDIAVRRVTVAIPDYLLRFDGRLRHIFSTRVSRTDYLRTIRYGSSKLLAGRWARPVRRRTSHAWAVSATPPSGWREKPTVMKCSRVRRLG